jgi:hypothetical protein
MDVKDRIYVPPKRRGLPLRYEFEHPAKSYRWLALLVLAIIVGILCVVLR